jgi:hypothetical protein
LKTFKLGNPSSNNSVRSRSLMALFGSQDPQIVVDECRLTVEDELFVATLVPRPGTEP